MKKYIVAFLLTIFLSPLFSQDYKTGIGLRGGWTSGITAKHFFKENRAIEGIFSSGWGWRGYQFTLLYEIYKPAFTKEDVEGLFWYYGAGLHFGGGYYYDHWHPHPNNYWGGYWHRHRYSAFGIDGILGIEYKLPDIPFAVSLDIKPFIEFTNYDHAPFRFWDGAFSVRFVF